MMSTPATVGNRKVDPSALCVRIVRAVASGYARIMHRAEGSGGHKDFPAKNARHQSYLGEISPGHRVFPRSAARIRVLAERLPELARVNRYARS